MSGKLIWRICLVFVWASCVMFYGGCADPTTKTGKYTDEEMETIPFAERSGLPTVSGGVVLSVDTETITVDDVLTPPIMKFIKPASGSNFKDFSAKARAVVKDSVVERVTGILLYKEAKKQAPANIDDVLDKAVKKEESKFLALHGNDWGKAQEVLREEGMDLEQFREMKKRVLLTQSYYLSQDIWEEEPITHSEMLEFYDAMQRDGFAFKGLLKKEDVKWDGVIQFRLIDLDSAKLEADDIDIDALESPMAAALRKAKKLMAELDNGADFAELAKEHSDGHRAADGGLWTPITGGSRLVSKYAILQDTAEAMEVGEIAGPIEANKHAYIVKLEEKKEGGKASFADLQKKIEYDIRHIRQKERVGRLIGKLLEQANISNLDPFVDFCTKKAWDRWLRGEVEG